MAKHTSQTIRIGESHLRVRFTDSPTVNTLPASRPYWSVANWQGVTCGHKHRNIRTAYNCRVVDGEVKRYET